MTTELKVYRRSELEAIASGCLHRYRALWIDGVDDSSDISLIGSGFAKIKHLYVMRLVERRLSRDAEEAEAAFIEGAAITQTPAHLLPELRRLWQFHAEKFDLDVSRFVLAEERADTGGVAWAPDLVLAHPSSNSLEIVDDKSGWSVPPTETELRENFQARVYSRYARDRWPNFSAYVFTLYAIRFNKRVTVSFSQSDLDAVDTEIQAAIATIELAKAANEWPAIPGPACRFCQLACPVADQKITLPKRLTLEQREPLAGWMLVAEKQVKALRKLLKESVSTHGPIDVNGVVWDNRPSESRSYPIDALLEAFRKLKIDRQAPEVLAAGGDLTISHSALTKVLKLYPELEHLLEKSVRSKTTFRFTAKKPGDDEEDEG